jgi:hypothetical protein
VKRAYAHPVLMRAGLANMLMPWGRAIVWAHENDAPALAPRWFKLRLGPYRRLESDKRRYERCFTTSGYVTGLERTAALMLGTRIPEGAELPRTGSPAVVRFEGLGSYLDPLLSHHELLDHRLRQMTRPELLPPSDGDFVGVHVRLGDYPTAWRVPIEWYAEAVRELSAQLGRNVAVRVFSDGRNEELEPLLRLPDVTRAPERAAVTDMLELSQAACIVASPSTFSAWAGFLRQSPMLWPPGRSMRSHTNQNTWRSHEWDARSPLPERMLTEVARRTEPFSVQTRRSSPGRVPADPS